MSYQAFIEMATAQDTRNKFEKCSDCSQNVPDEVRSFYRECNPIDVEIDYDGVGVRFFPAAELSDLQSEYSYLHAQFVFAVCNSDPIFLHDGRVYTCPHGVKETKWEKLADNFCDYLKLLINKRCL